MTCVAEKRELLKLYYQEFSLKTDVFLGIIDDDEFIPFLIEDALKNAISKDGIEKVVLEKLVVEAFLEYYLSYVVFNYLKSMDDDYEKSNLDESLKCLDVNEDFNCLIDSHDGLEDENIYYYYIENCVWYYFNQYTKIYQLEYSKDFDFDETNPLYYAAYNYFIKNLDTKFEGEDNTLRELIDLNINN